MDCAYVKFQGIFGEEFFVKQVTLIPLILANAAHQNQNDQVLTSLNMLKCQQLPRQIALIYWNPSNQQFSLIPLTTIIVNNIKWQQQYKVDEIIEQIQNYKSLDAMSEYNGIILESNNQLYFPCETCKIPHSFFFLLPLKEAVRTESFQTKTPNKSSMNPFNKVHDKVAYSKWSTEERDSLKRFFRIYHTCFRIILQYGYGRWNKINEQSQILGGKLHLKTKSELRAFSNAFVRSVIELIQTQNPELKTQLLNIAEEFFEDPYIEANQSKIILYMYFNRGLGFTEFEATIVSCRQTYLSAQQNQDIYQEIQRRSTHKDGNQGQKILQIILENILVNWDNMLAFVPASLFYSQRPAIWWTRKHDSDLLRGVYKYGYTNQTAIKQATDLCFIELEQCKIYHYILLENNYHEFPQAETLNRRVKKLVQIIVKYENENKPIDFEEVAESEEEDKSWTVIEKQQLFQLICDYGVPITVDGRQNWSELKDKLNNSIISAKTISQVEKMVQTIRTKCEQIMMKSKQLSKLYDNSSESSSESEQEVNQMPEENEKQEEPLQEQQQDKQQENDEFYLNLEEAKKFSKQTNILHFIRKNVFEFCLSLLTYFHASGIRFERNQMKISTEKIISKIKLICKSYFSLNFSRLLLQQISNQGFQSLKLLPSDWLLSIDSAMQRIEFLCNFFKRIREQQNQSRKRKTEFILRDDVQKKVKIVEKDINGELVLPMQVNPSLKLINLGRIIPSTFYHSEHNLFPVGFKSVRSYASMFTRGVRCQYTCEIMEGGDGKPIFKVISEEDQDNPIIRNSCTGCWIQVCNKVNEIAEHKKAKVTISGTDRFGLLEPNVQRYLEELPGAERCTKYKFKYRQNFDKSLFQ